MQIIKENVTLYHMWGSCSPNNFFIRCEWSRVLETHRQYIGEYIKIYKSDIGVFKKTKDKQNNSITYNIYFLDQDKIMRYGEELDINLRKFMKNKIIPMRDNITNTIEYSKKYRFNKPDWLIKST